jgi:hypothetical protein
MTCNLTHRTENRAQTRRAEDGWYDDRYIYPEGFHSTTKYRSSVDPNMSCTHHSYIVGLGGEFWPLPTFKVVAADRPYEPVFGRTCSGGWRAVRNQLAIL